MSPIRMDWIGTSCYAKRLYFCHSCCIRISLEHSQKTLSKTAKLKHKCWEFHEKKGKQTDLGKCRATDLCRTQWIRCSSTRKSIRWLMLLNERPTGKIWQRLMYCRRGSEKEWSIGREFACRCLIVARQISICPKTLSIRSIQMQNWNNFL